MLFSVSAWAGDGLVVDLGFGRVKIQSQGVSVSPRLLEEVETQLLIDEEFARLVTESHTVSIELDSAFLPQNLTKESLLSALRDRMRIAEADRKKEVADDKEEPESDHRGRSKWVLGGKFSVGADDVFDELYVLGGDVDIAGRVEKLYVMGGNVHLRSSSLIDDGVWVLGGRVVVDDGARHPRIQSESDWEWHWPGDHMEFEERELLSWLWLTFLIVWLLATGMLFFIGQTFGPQFQERVQSRLKQSFAGSAVVGLLFYFSVPMLLVVLLVSLVGVLAIPFVLSLLTVVFFYGYAHLALWLVTEVFRIERGRPLLAGTLGLLGIFVVSIFVPTFFGLVTFLILASSGAYLMTLAEAFFSRRSAAAPKS